VFCANGFTQAINDKKIRLKNSGRDDYEIIATARKLAQTGKKVILK